MLLHLTPPSSMNQLSLKSSQTVGTTTSWDYWKLYRRHKMMASQQQVV
jgi:hypothetical protein